MSVSVLVTIFVVLLVLALVIYVINIQTVIDANIKPLLIGVAVVIAILVILGYVGPWHPLR